MLPTARGKNLNLDGKQQNMIIVEKKKKQTDLRHSWISPDYYLVLGESMSTNKFIDILRPCQIAHLSHKNKDSLS